MSTDALFLEMRASLTTISYRRGLFFRSTKVCFLGQDAVSWLVDNEKASNDMDATATMQMMLESKCVISVDNASHFKSNAMYKFSKHVQKEASTRDPSFWDSYIGKAAGGKTASKHGSGLQSDVHQNTFEDKSGHFHDSNSQENFDESISPKDEWNVKLLNNVHPRPWQDPTPPPMYNLVVLGGGTGGLVSSIGSVGFGAKVALVEGSLLGGDCTNYGCVPSKLLIKSANVAHTIRTASQYGMQINEDSNLEVNFASVMERLRKVRSHISGFEAAERLKRLGIDVYIGTGVFDSPNSLVVNGHTLRFRKCVICSGGQAYVPHLPGLASVQYLTNETLFSLVTQPKRMVVIGGGPIGIEMAQAFQRLGTNVTILVRGVKILDREDADAARIVENALHRDGVRILTNAKKQVFEPLENGLTRVTVEILGQDEPVVITADEVLLATGRKPRVKGLALDVAKIAYNESDGILVNDNMLTSNPLVYAAGDCCSKFQFTHMAEAMAILCLQNALFFGSSKFSSLLIPWCTFTSPEIAHVGLYPSDLETKGIKYITYSRPFMENDRSEMEGGQATEGFIKIHVRQGTDKILGCTIVGEGAGDLISQVTTLIQSGTGLIAASNIIHPYPTRADLIRRIGQDCYLDSFSPFVRGAIRSIFSLGT